MPRIDVEELPDGHKYKISLEKDESPADAAARRTKEHVLFGVALVLCVLPEFGTRDAAEATTART